MYCKRVAKFSKIAPSMDLHDKRMKIRNAALASAILCASVLGGAYYLLPFYIQFPDAITDRIVFALRVDLFILLWVLLGVGLVARARRHSAHDIDGALRPPSPRIAIELAFLQNTLEQAVLTIGVHVVLATLLEPHALALLVASVVLFAVGRITFLRGYRRGAEGRAFGMVTTVLPTLAGYGLALVLLARHVLQ